MNKSSLQPVRPCGYYSVIKGQLCVSVHDHVPFFASVVVCFTHRNAICLCALLCFHVIFFFFLHRQCAACTHERKGNIVCSVSLYSGTYQLKGCCLDSLRWGYSVKKQAIQMSEHWGKFFTTHLITENITAEGLVGGTSRGLYCGFFFFIYFYNSHTFLAAPSS